VSGRRARRAAESRANQQLDPDKGPNFSNALIKKRRAGDPRLIVRRIHFVTGRLIPGKDLMAAQTHPDQPHYAQPAGSTEPGTVQPVSPLSRRSLLRGAGGVGAVGFAAAAGAGAVFAASRPAGTGSAGAAPAAADKAVTTDVVSELAAGEPLVVYLRDIKSGEFEIFNGTRQVKVTNPTLAADLVRGLQSAH
jgi:hypothetical protein